MSHRFRGTVIIRNHPPNGIKQRVFASKGLCLFPLTIMGDLGDQDADFPDLQCTPISVDRLKTHDPNRNPETNISVPADKKRDNAMNDAPRTTVLMCLEQFKLDKLHGAGEDFEQARGANNFVDKVWFTFNEAFGVMPDKTGAKTAWSYPSEKKLSNVWVRGFLLVSCLDADWQTAGESRQRAQTSPRPLPQHL